MRIIHSPAGLRRFLRRKVTIGFVPTLGALHDGHLSLIRAARRENDVVVVSIFVNPIQFDRARDLRSYPRTLARDARLAARAGADVVFAPPARAMYPPGFQTSVEVARLSRPLEGLSRPGHFRGVTTVVTKLFNLVRPDRTYFGQKDAQQARIVRQLIRDLDFPIRLRVLPTVREGGGLALSSRNARLSTGQRRAARALFEALQSGKRLIEWGFRRETAVVQRVRGRLRRVRGLKTEYVAVVDPDTFERVRLVRRRALILAACRLGGTRLIDNVRAVPPP
ncbi:MAG: pantoate--beta-alanine ligase [Candidatus Omnitrophica bacterium]|nr:pantoate--beta-alanine ligase [Candidatus Omnitrophota bacterium]